MTVSELGRQIRSGEVSCVELMKRTLDEMEERDRFNSVITLMAEPALAEAAERDKELAAGRDRGPFHGIPIAHKDNYYTKGVRTTAGSLIFADFVPEYDATVVERFREAGAICVAKTNMHELAFGITSKNPHYGSVLNPRDTTRIAGGSSGGSAALVAAGLLPLATGSDTGGSVRVPASYCGIVGLKPTYGLVSRRGLLPLSFSLDCAGPLATCVADCALALEVMAGVAPLPPLQDLSGIRVGVPRATYFQRVDIRVLEAVEGAISKMEALGATVFEVKTPDMEELNAVSRIVQLSETAALFGHYTDPAQFGPDVWALVQQGKQLAAHEYVNAQRVRTSFRRQFNAIWKQVDVLVTPTTPITAPLLTEDKVRIGDEVVDVRLATTSLVRSFNLLGEPALSMPSEHFTKRSPLPVGIQLIGKTFSDAKLLRIAAILGLN